MAEVKWYGQQVYAEINSKSDKIINDLALFVHKAVVESMRGGKSGREYRLPLSKQTYTASAPGEAPAVRTGAYRDSIVVEFVAPAHRRVGTHDDRGLDLELGTKNMGARPHIRPALDKAVAESKRLIGANKL